MDNPSRSRSLSKFCRFVVSHVQVGDDRLEGVPVGGQRQAFGVNRRACGTRRSRAESRPAAQLEAGWSGQRLLTEAVNELVALELAEFGECAHASATCFFQVHAQKSSSRKDVVRGHVSWLVSDSVRLTCDTKLACEPRPSMGRKYIRQK